MFSPRSTPRPRPISGSIDPAVANAIATEYASLRSIGALPTGLHVIPSSDSIGTWEGVLFIRHGPYDKAVLRFSILFELDYPRSSPKIRFDNNVYHPMVDPRSKEWTSRGSLARWQPGVHHVTHLLHALVADFRTESLESVTEEQAINKQLYSLYRNSNHTFLSMTAQRSLRSISRDVLYPSVSFEEHDQDGRRADLPASPTSSSGSKRPDVPVTPTKQTRVRLDSGLSSGSSSAGDQFREEGMIRFRPLKEGEKEDIEGMMERRIWDFLPTGKNVHEPDTG